jgi:hypothetical protein
MDDTPMTTDARACGPEQVAQVQAWIAQNPGWSRYRLSRELCRQWGWVRPNGQLADMAARHCLLKLHQRQRITLPPRQCASPNRMRHRQLECVPLERSPVVGKLRDLGRLELHEVSADPERRALFETLLAREHYLGYRSAVGENLKYLLCTGEGRPLSAWLFGAAAWRCQARDQWIGWSERQRAKGLGLLTNNTRFLIPEWVQVSGLASWGWARVSRCLAAGWEAKYGHRIELVETFVDTSRFAGSVYASSNWMEVGLTKGRSRGDRQRQIQVPPKAVYVYPLGRDFRQRLCA